MSDWSAVPTPPPTSAPPGWYPDPSGAAGQRYWDGQLWTEHLAGPPAAAAPVMTYAGPPARSIGFGEAVSRGLRGWSDYSSRATVAEYWWFVLFEIAVLVPLYIIGIVVLAATARTSSSSSSTGTSSSTSVELTGISTIGIIIVIVLFLVAALLLVFPRIALTVRRLHDTDHSGWWYFIAFVPFGSIVLLFFFLLAGTPGPNRYGPVPQ